MEKHINSSNEGLISTQESYVGDCEYSGVCGAGGGVVWSLSENGETLTISGIGAMDDYASAKLVPWRERICDIVNVEIENGVTTVGDYAFKDAVNLRSVTIAGSVDVLGTGSFYDCSSLAEISLPEGLTVIGAKTFSGCKSLRIVRLPSTLTNIDMKAFCYDDMISDVFFAGSENWWRRVAVSPSAARNTSLLKAKFHYAKPNDGEYIPHAGADIDRYDMIISAARSALEKNGDGRLYILTLDLMFDGLKNKSGDCALIIFPDGKTMMIDAGFTACAPIIITLMKDLGLAGLDYFMISHPHIDHVGGGMAVAEYIYESGGEIGTYCVNTEENFKGDEPSLREYLREKGVKIADVIYAGDKWHIGMVEAAFFSSGTDDRPEQPGDGAEDMNNRSLGLKLTYGKSSYLTAGDLYVDKEKRLAEKYGAALRADVMKANHHGLYTSNSLLWLETVSPKIIIAPADDIGSTTIARRIAAAGIEYYSVGMDGLTMIGMDDCANYEVLCRRESTLREDIIN